MPALPSPAAATAVAAAAPRRSAEEEVALQFERQAPISGLSLGNFLDDGLSPHQQRLFGPAESDPIADGRGGAIASTFSGPSPTSAAAGRETQAAVDRLQRQLDAERVNRQKLLWAQEQKLLRSHQEFQEEMAELSDRLRDAQYGNEVQGEAANEALRSMASSEEACREELFSCAEGEAEAAREIRNQLRRCESELERCQAPQRLRNSRRDQRLQRGLTFIKLERALARNIAREMLAAKEGRALDKVDQRHSRRDERLVCLSDTERVLRWGRPPGPLPSNCTKLELKDVIRMEYGRASRAWNLHSDVAPWLCFSLYTTERSFDFISPDEDIVQCFVLAISRLCEGVVGTIDSRSRFVSLKGWYKVQDGCLKNKVSLSRVFLEALRKTARGELSKARPRGDSSNPFSRSSTSDEDAYYNSNLNPFTFIARSSDGSS